MEVEPKVVPKVVREIDPQKIWLQVDSSGQVIKAVIEDG